MNEVSLNNTRFAILDPDGENICMAEFGCGEDCITTDYPKSIRILVAESRKIFPNIADIDTETLEVLTLIANGTEEEKQAFIEIAKAMSDIQLLAWVEERNGQDIFYNYKDNGYYSMDINNLEVSFKKVGIPVSEFDKEYTLIEALAELYNFNPRKKNRAQIFFKITTKDEPDNYMRFGKNWSKIDKDWHYIEWAKGDIALGCEEAHFISNLYARDFVKRNMVYGAQQGVFKVHKIFDSRIDNEWHD